MRRTFKLINVWRNSSGKGIALYLCDLETGWVMADGRYEAESVSHGWSICEWRNEIFLAPPAHAVVRNGEIVRNAQDEIEYVKDLEFAKTSIGNQLRNTLNALAQTVFKAAEAQALGVGVVVKPSEARTRTAGDEASWGPRDSDDLDTDLPL